MPVCARVRPCLEQPRTHVPVPSRSTMRALAWRGQVQAYGCYLWLANAHSRPRGPRPRLSVAKPRVNSNPHRRPSHRHQANPVLDRDPLFARRYPHRVVCCLCQHSSRRAALFRRRRSAHAHLHSRESSPALPVPNGARACSRTRTLSQASCHAAADTLVATPRSSSRTEPFTIAPPCSFGSFISRPHARACARPSCRLCSPCSRPVNTFTCVSRT
jgi:hypothetical protein